MPVARSTTSRVQVRREAGATELTIRATRSWLTIAFLSVWLAGWGKAALSALDRLLAREEPDLTILLWLGVWICFGILAVGAIAYQLAGREVVTVRDRTLTLGRGVGRLVLSRAYDLAQVRHLRAEDPRLSVSPQPFARRRRGPRGTFAFDYGPSTIRFGDGVRGADVEKVLAILSERMATRI